MSQPYFHPGPRRIAAALLIAGFPDDDTVLSTMVAIHGAETSGNVWAIGGPNQNGSLDYGAFQVNVPKGVLPPSGWDNYITNAQLAKGIYNHQGYHGWYGYANIGRPAGFQTIPKATWRQWGAWGVADMRKRLATGRSLYTIASVYLPLDGVPQ